MKISRKTDLTERLYELAQIQNGYFTANQARKLGYRNRNFPYYVRKKRWLQMIRGVYRLKHFPESQDEQYSLWALWVGAKNGIPIGTYSHITALNYYELSEIIPSKLHITVPKTYKTTRKLPSILIFHRENIPDNDIKYMEGYAMTTPERTLFDLAKDEMMERDHFAQAVLLTYKKGYISKKFIYENPEFRIILPIITKLIQ